MLDINYNDFLNIIGNICLIVGGFFVFTGSLGILRMKDFFTRLHPAGVSDSAGVILIFLGILFKTTIGTISLKIILLIIFSLLTSATACHALAKSSLIDKDHK